MFLELRRLPRRQEGEQGQIVERGRARVRAAAASTAPENYRHGERELLEMPE